MALVQGVGNLGVYGSIYIDEGATIQVVATGASQLVTGFSLSGKGANGPANDVVPDKANDKITLTNAGVYRIALSCSFLAGTGSVKWEFEARDAGGKIVGLCGHCDTSTNGIGYAGFNNFYTAAAGAVIKLWVNHNQAGNENFTPVDVQLSVERISQAG